MIGFLICLSTSSCNLFFRISREWRGGYCSVLDVAKRHSQMLQDKGLKGKGYGKGLTQGSTTKLKWQVSGMINTDKPKNLNIISINVRGLNSPYKRSTILHFLRRKGVDVALMQETHLKLNDISRVQDRLYKPIVASSDGTHTKGVMILMRRNLNLSIEKTGSDGKGRLAFCCASIEGKKVAFVSIYAPTVFEGDFFPTITKQLLKLSDYYLYIGSDMNALANISLDKSSTTMSGSQESASKALNNFIKDLNLTDVWRMYNPSVRDYTFFSSRHKAFSRIDYILVSSTLLPLVQAIDFLPRYLSDHNPIISTFNYGKIKNRSTRWRFNSTLLKDDEYLKQLRSKLTEFICINKNSVSDTTIFWAAIKGFLRNNAIGYSSHIHKNRLQKISTLENQCQALEKDLKRDYSITKENELKLKQAELNDLLRNKAEYMIHITKHKYYAEGSRPSHLLALTLKQQEAKRSISAIKCPKDGVVVSTDEINETFKKYFKELYSRGVVPSEDELNIFFADLKLPTLSAEDAKMLDSPITIDELLSAVKATNKGRTPGIDGIPVEIYLAIWDIIGPIWLETLNYAVAHGSFHRDLNTALITVIPKPGKDPLECANYRPISLINADLKIFSKVLAIRLEIVVGKIINPDQTGFIKGRLAADNIRRLLHILGATHKIPINCGLLFLDAEKAFDRLEWPYLWRVLKEFNFGDRFINMIQTLYANPTARVCVGGGLSDLFVIERGTRQGDPLSPLIFNLSIEPLAHLIRTSSQFSPITIGTTSHSVSLYADDALIYMADLQLTLPNVLKTLDNFGCLSGYKVNLSKSAVMLINTDKGKVTLPPQLEVVNEIRYLGIEISASLSAIVKTNYLKILKDIEEDIGRWRLLPASVPARISTIKMNILPRINFISLMIPLAPPMGYWQRLDSLLRRYIWNGKRPSIKWSMLQSRKTSGGLACPNFKLYHWAFVLRALRYWMGEDAVSSSWKRIEQDLIAPIRLKDFPLIGMSIKKCTLYYGPILTYMLQVFRAVEKFINYKSVWCRSSPLWNNNHFISGGKPFSNKYWGSKGINTLQDIDGESTILDFQELVSRYGIDKHSLFFYFRVRSACKAYRVPWGSELKEHPILCWILDASERIVSYIYDKLISEKYTPSVGMKAWERETIELGKEIDWEAIWDNVVGASKNPNHQYIHLKFAHRAYITPRIRHQMGMAPDPFCSFCPQGTIGSFIHMVWECPRVFDLWRGVIFTLEELTGVQLPMDLAVHLLNDDSLLSLTEKTRKIWLAGLTAAKKIVVQRWKHPHVISNIHWTRCFLDIAYLELSSARINKARARTILMWKNLISDLNDILLK